MTSIDKILVAHNQKITFKFVFMVDNENHGHRLQMVDPISFGLLSL